MPDRAKSSPKPSKQVAKLIGLGWSSACDGLAALSWFEVRRRPNESLSRFIDIYAGDRKVQVYISPTGRSVRVFVDGQEA